MAHGYRSNNLYTTGKFAVPVVESLKGERFALFPLSGYEHHLSHDRELQVGVKVNKDHVDITYRQPEAGYEFTMSHNAPSKEERTGPTCPTYSDYSHHSYLYHDAARKHEREPVDPNKAWEEQYEVWKSWPECKNCKVRYPPYKPCCCMH
ncbi:hypothetical protein EV182_002321 [Spiromyces aspiralis]|uniref:Uncharacterized protein n=1 Tax=Spiromyces aspiralis TaxID=68401 RepID=A0ACC1HEB3_9FUNG|nr:hypothetical protein EV182_002321 [Spiromyces aspiralis]